MPTSDCWRTIRRVESRSRVEVERIRRAWFGAASPWMSFFKSLTALRSSRISRSLARSSCSNFWFNPWMTASATPSTSTLAMCLSSERVSDAAQESCANKRLCRMTERAVGLIDETLHISHPAPIRSECSLHHFHGSHAGNPFDKAIRWKSEVAGNFDEQCAVWDVGFYKHVPTRIILC